MTVRDDDNNHTYDLANELGRRLGCSLNANNALLLVSAHPDLFFYVKDKNSRFCYLNKMTWQGLGAKTEQESLGKTDMDFHPPILASAYLAEDRKVLDGENILNRVWLVHNLGLRLPQWVVSSKVALYDSKRNTVGIAGVMYQLESSKFRSKYFQELEPAIRYMEENAFSNINIEDIASQVECSRTQLNRRFQDLLHMTPSEFLTAHRVQQARHLLTHSDRSLAAIAVESGFCDQSHFTRRFREVTGETPAAFRHHHLKNS